MSKVSILSMIGILLGFLTVILVASRNYEYAFIASALVLSVMVLLLWEIRRYLTRVSNKALKELRAESRVQFDILDELAQAQTESAGISVVRKSQRLDGPTKEHFLTLSRRVANSNRPVPGIRRVLFVSSNGAGLGHLTRLSAIDNQLEGCQTMFYTLSSAHGMLGKSRQEIEYFPSHRDLGMDGSAWNPLMEAHLDAVVEGFDPDLIVFDGTYVFQGIIRVSRRRKTRLVWIQRGCWKPEVDQTSKQRHAADKFASAVIIPGDYGCEEVVDVGEGLTPHYVPPITLVQRETMLDRDQARTQLGLPLDKKLFLIQLGAGVINDIDNLRSIAVETVKQLGDDWEPVLVRNPLSNHVDFPEVHSIQAYPLGLYYRAFDAGVFAAGYNTVQESIELSLPSIFVPNKETKTDDQIRRAREVRDQGLALCAESLDELRESIIKLGNVETCERLMARHDEERSMGGASEAAKYLAALL